MCLHLSPTNPLSSPATSMISAWSLPEGTRHLRRVSQWIHWEHQLHPWDFQARNYFSIHQNLTGEQEDKDQPLHQTHRFSWLCALQFGTFTKNKRIFITGNLQSSGKSLKKKEKHHSFRQHAWSWLVHCTNNRQPWSSFCIWHIVPTMINHGQWLVQCTKLLTMVDHSWYNAPNAKLSNMIDHVWYIVPTIVNHAASKVMYLLWFSRRL